MDKSVVDIVSPSRFLALAVIEQAKDDLENPVLCKSDDEREFYRNSAEHFLNGEWGHKRILDFWCSVADIEGIEI